jgi:hypothetical protein
MTVKRGKRRRSKRIESFQSNLRSCIRKDVRQGLSKASSREMIFHVCCRKTKTIRRCACGAEIIHTRVSLQLHRTISGKLLFCGPDEIYLPDELRVERAKRHKLEGSTTRGEFDMLRVLNKCSRKH